MLNQKIQDALNEQIKNELYSAYLYLSMSAYCESVNMPGMANWMRMQELEERVHALKMFDFVNERGGRVVLQAIDQPPAEFESLLDVFEKTLAHEQKVTAMINNLYALAVREQDYASQIFLQWFVTEQVEEEDSVGQVIETLKMIGDSRQGLLMLDRELGGRAAPQTGQVQV
ncbi:MAG: ferritin [Chloroflexi bacterium]|nr:MAG: ferritin [Chloroflexota bacterium]